MHTNKKLNERAKREKKSGNVVYHCSRCGKAIHGTLELFYYAGEKCCSECFHDAQSEYGEDRSY